MVTIHTSILRALLTAAPCPTACATSPLCEDAAHPNDLGADKIKRVIVRGKDSITRIGDMCQAS